MKDNERKQFIENRDSLRLMEEQKEAARRRMVMNGQWTEENSQEKMKEFIIEADKNAPESIDEYKGLRDFHEMKNLFTKLQSPSKIYDKEYYFDEGLGQNLKEHVEDLKTRFPELTILVRRDRDGYPIVKTQYIPKYKYNLDRISNFDHDAEMTIVKESLDDILKTMLG